MAKSNVAFLPVDGRSTAGAHHAPNLNPGFFGRAHLQVVQQDEDELDKHRARMLERYGSNSGGSRSRHVYEHGGRRRSKKR